MKLEEVNQEILICRKCGYRWKVSNEIIYWDEHGLGYSTKLCNCEKCNTPNVMEYNEDCSLDLNKDTRWYE